MQSVWQGKLNQKNVEKSRPKDAQVKLVKTEETEETMETVETADTVEMVENVKAVHLKDWQHETKRC